jgi:hypothetical protein
MSDNTYPLTAQHYDSINAGLLAINAARQIIGRAQAAGMDVRQHTELANHLENQLTGLKTQFFPRGKPQP